MADDEHSAGKRPPRVAIACQGGGSHAAFGAGVLHRLLEDHGRRYRLVALSGTSGGAVNAALVWSGLIQGGPPIAQARLTGMWGDLKASNPVDMARNFWGQVVANAPYTWEVSPYVVDLGARREMEDHLRDWLKLEAMPKEAARLNDPALFVGATDILNGVSVAIRGDGRAITRKRRMVRPLDEPFDYDDIIASIAIPPLFKDVERRGTRFWDGLFSINPPINALTNVEPRPDEIWVIRINPQVRRAPPESIREITDRRNELSGNLSLNKELDMIETVNEMLHQGLLAGSHYKPIRIHIVGLEETDPNLGYASKFDRSPKLIDDLFELGRTRAPDLYHGEMSERSRFTQRQVAAPHPAP